MCPSQEKVLGGQQKTYSRTNKVGASIAIHAQIHEGKVPLIRRRGITRRCEPTHTGQGRPFSSCRIKKWGQSSLIVTVKNCVKQVFRILLRWKLVEFIHQRTCLGWENTKQSASCFRGGIYIACVFTVSPRDSRGQKYRHHHKIGNKKQNKSNHNSIAIRTGRPRLEMNHL